jgi:hypothetical protein
MEQANRDCIALDTGALLDRQGRSTRVACSSIVDRGRPPGMDERARVVLLDDRGPLDHAG